MKPLHFRYAGMLHYKRKSMYEISRLIACYLKTDRSFIVKNVMGLVIILMITSFTVSAQNEIVNENKLTGSPKSEWDPPANFNNGDIYGFATEMSVNKGAVVKFKIRSSDNYKVDIYRFGYYQGNGARKVGAGSLITPLPFKQPLNITNAETGLIDCSNWTVNAQWQVPTSAVSGVYMAKIYVPGTPLVNHILFVVRDDASQSDLYFKTSDATWQAYNDFGEYGTWSANFYYGRRTYFNDGENVTTYPNGRAVKISYDRPFQNRTGSGNKSYFFSTELPMIKWLERNGYSVSYFTDVDADKNGTLIKNHKAMLSVGHDEYWSGRERANVEAARDAGVNLAFFSGNEVYWKTRWEPATDGRLNRILVCYKEGNEGEYACGSKCDPSTEWTGLWRNGCTSPNGNACKPENLLTGQLSYFLTGNTVGINVPASVKDYRFWRNTSVENLTSGQVLTTAPGTLGYEMDYEDNSFAYPEGRVRMSETTIEGKTHKLALFRHKNGALVFGAGTIQWAWGLDEMHDIAGTPVDKNIQQATVNILADMEALPVTLQSDLVKASTTTDRFAPISMFYPVKQDDLIKVGEPFAISGFSLEYPGVIAGVEVSVDGGTTWNEATGGKSWSYSWTPQTAGVYSLKVRAYDDMGNMETYFSRLNSITVRAGVPLPIMVSIPDAAAYKEGVEVNTVYPGYDPAEEITLKSVISGGKQPYFYQWSNGSTKSSITVSPKSKTTYTLKITDADGTVQTTSKIILVENVACSDKKNTVLVCTKGKTDCEKEDKVEKLLSKGSMLGSCNSSKNTVNNSSITQQRGIATEETPVFESLNMVVETAPNPSSSYFNMVVRSKNTTDKITLRVINLQGKLIETMTINANQRVQLGSQFNPGIYLVEAVQGSTKTITKLIKN